MDGQAGPSSREKRVWGGDVVLTAPELLRTDSERMSQPRPRVEEQAPARGPHGGSGCSGDGCHTLSQARQTGAASTLVACLLEAKATRESS